MKKRIIFWIISLIIAFSFQGVLQYQKNKPKETTKKEATKKNLYLYNDSIDEKKIKNKFESSSLNTKYKLNFTDDSRAADGIITNNLDKLNAEKDDIIVNSYTPLVIAMKNSHELERYVEEGILTAKEGINNSVKDEISINFKKVIDTVIKKKSKEDKNSFRIIVPKEDSIEGKIFYKFLLVTINGTYPDNEVDLEKAKEKAIKFLESSNCVEKEDVINELKTISSINATDLYVLFEADFMNSTIWKQKELDLSITYPNVTVVKHMYMKAVKEQKELNDICNSLVKEMNYRSSKNHSFSEEKNYNVKEDITFVEVSEEEEDDGGYIFLLIFLIILGCLIGTIVICVIGG